MKITAIETFVCNARMRNWVFVKVVTDQPGLYSGLPAAPAISPLVGLWKGIAKPLAVAGMIGAVVAGFFHYMKVGPVEENEKEGA